MLLISRIFIGPGTPEARKYKCVVAPGNSTIRCTATYSSREESQVGLLCFLFVVYLKVFQPDMFIPKQSEKLSFSSAKPELFEPAAPKQNDILKIIISREKFCSDFLEKDKI